MAVGRMPRSGVGLRDPDVLVAGQFLQAQQSQGPMERSQRKGLHRASAMGTRKNCYVPSSNDTNGRGNSDRGPCKPHGVKPHVVTTPTIIWRLASKEIAQCSNTFERNWSANKLPLIPAHPGLAR
uniref:Uncharacterized protein n=1 Tax=Coccidioides posadasii RMSCC 3488 TaxID=454284 RepID=A0A0J6FTF3_COCPO|nr:hypothetical protein CPAG_08693 [Coccidioides posadasii RMSCC 3488]